MTRVYFKPVNSYSNTEEISKGAAQILNTLKENEKIGMEKFIPLKVHFGEKGNKTFIEPKNFDGIIDYLKNSGIDSAYIETNVLYRGERTTSTKHLKLAKDHGFDQIPVIIADGEHGEEYENVEINQKNLKLCKIAREIHKQKQLIVLSHFKGHILAGFGGAIKQLAMGCSSRGGKLEQHTNSIPGINYYKCKSCKACIGNCPENAIILKSRARIDKSKCVGCASCIAVCPHKAVTFSWLGSLSKVFFERLAEYAYAASLEKNNIYISFAFNITKGCDCEGHLMKKVAGDIGIFASTDPVAIDKACLDMLDKTMGKKVFTKGRYVISYGERIGLGSASYELIEL